MRLSTVLPICVLALLVGGCEVLFEPVGEAPGAPAAEVTQASRTAVSGGDEGTAEVVSEAESDARPVATSDTAISSQAGSTDASEPLPGDMLTAEEQSEAIDLALAGSEARELVAAAVDRDGLIVSSAAGPWVTDVQALGELGGKPSYRVVYVQRRWDKGTYSRLAEVLLYRYDSDQAALVQVDLDSGRTTQLDFGEIGVVPLGPREISEAAAIARADDRVADALEGLGLPEDAAVTATLTVATGSGDRCAEHRCVRLFFSTLRAPVPALAAVVDSVDLEVVEIESLAEPEVQP